jgi:ribose 1,5-bisphosphokinase PhnN
VKRIPALVITGPVGAGKSTTVAAMSEELDRRAVPHVVFDMDYLRWLHPNPDGDPFAAQVGYRNLAATWPNMQVVPLQCVLLADVVESRAQVDAYAAAMPGTDVRVVRLDVPMPVIMDRLEGRETEQTIAWHRNRAPELQGIMVREQVADIVIDVGERTAADVALEILHRTGAVSPGSG